MKIIAMAAVAIVLGLATVSVARAGTASGTTAIVGGVAHANTPTDVDVSIVGGAPSVPYEYSLINRCWFSGKTSGPSDSYERFDLFGPWFDVGGVPHMTVTVNNNPVSAGANCKVLLIHNNTVVKGSTTAYSVVP